MLKKLPIVLALLVATLAAIYWGASADVPADRPHYAQSTLTVTRADGVRFPFATEIALTEPEQAYGLMFIKSMPDTRSMIFPYAPAREVSFWMKDTLIPLDMLFVDKDHKISHIIAHARPLDLTPLSSQGPVIAVIEINGGLASRQGFAVGDRVDWPALTTSPKVGKSDPI